MSVDIIYRKGADAKNAIACSNNPMIFAKPNTNKTKNDDQK